MHKIDEIKENLTLKLSEQYSKNIISLGEYERVLDYLNKIETENEFNIIEKIIHEIDLNKNELTIIQNNNNASMEAKNKHFSMFSWRTSNVKFKNGYGGKYISLFGTNRIIVENLPEEKAILNVESIFGLTEILVSENIKVIIKAVPVFSGIFVPNEINKEKDNFPELHITGKAIFGKIVINTI